MSQKITIPIEAPSHSYAVQIGTGLLQNAGEQIKSFLPDATLVIVTDDIVASIYADSLRTSLEDAGYRVLTYVFPHGEASKSVEVWATLLEYLAKNHITRSDALIALGGGVVGDLTGFAAASYLRSIPFIQIPTTLLAAIDSSVGGKTAINLTGGKNLAGAFYQPSLVLCDPSTFDTLPDEILADGMAEALKYGMLADEPLFALLENGTEALTLEEYHHIIRQCVEIKAEIVAKDERDIGIRQCLNLGHTIGHAIEKVSNYGVSHGHAVGAGMAIIARAAVAKGEAEATLSARLETGLKNCALPTHVGYTADELYAAALGDKKRGGNQITIVLPIKIGAFALKKIPVEELKEYIALGMEAPT